MRKIIAFLMSLMVIISITIPSFAANFQDVPDEAWYATFVNDLADKKVINGYPDGTFNPEGSVSVAEFIKLIIVASTKDIKYDLIEASFDHWASKYVKVAENYGAIDVGEYKLEDMDRPITRIEIVRILSKCDIAIKNTSQSYSLKEFTDLDGISAMDNAYLSHAVSIGVINGYPDGTFKPDNGLKRSECAKVIYTYTNR